MSDLAALHAQLFQCRKCLEAGYTITPGPVTRGSATAQIMLIGQAPGPTEAIVKRPFNAGSGQRLFQWLAEAGIDEDTFRATQYMTSVTKCFPGKSAGGGDRVPSKAEQALCRVWLDQELALLQPRLIIPVGKLAIGLFFDARLPLEHLIGTCHEEADRAIVPLPHPSGASTWHQKPANRVLVKQAVAHIHRHARRLGIVT